MSAPGEEGFETVDPLEFLHHDAVLLSVSFDWLAAEVRVDLRSARGDAPECVLLVRGVTRFACRRELPWGLSSSINAVRWGRASACGGSRLEVEMQSGDVLCIEAREFCGRRVLA